MSPLSRERIIAEQRAEAGEVGADSGGDGLHRGSGDANQGAVLANRAHRLSTQETDDRRTLSELSRKCAVDAVVEGLRLGDAKHSPAAAKTPRPR